MNVRVLLDQKPSEGLQGVACLPPQISRDGCRLCCPEECLHSDGLGAKRMMESSLPHPANRTRHGSGCCDIAEGSHSQKQLWWGAVGFDYTLAKRVAAFLWIQLNISSSTDWNSWPWGLEGWGQKATTLVQGLWGSSLSPVRSIMD